MPAEISTSHRRAFILQNTRLQRPAHIPELQLYLADEITPLWRMTEEELGETGVPPPYWAFVWVGGQAIARYLLDGIEHVAGKRLLDFAAGSGLCAIAARKAGAASVVAVDVDPYSAEAVALNAAANRVDITFTGRDLLDSDPPIADLILAGDVCYEQPMADRVLTWLHKAHARGTRVLIGDPGRPFFQREGLIQIAEYQVPTSREQEDREIKRAGVFTFPV